MSLGPFYLFLKTFLFTHSEYMRLAIIFVATNSTEVFSQIKYHLYKVLSQYEIVIS